MVKLPEKWRASGVLILSVLWTSYTLLYLFKVFFYFGIVVFPSIHRAISIGLLSMIAFLHFPARKGGSKGAWYDIVAVLLIIASCSYIAINAEELISFWGDASAMEMIFGIGLILCLIEIVRRSINWILPLIIIFFFFYTVYSNHFPGFLHSAGFSYQRTVSWMYLSAEGLWGMITGVVCTVVAGFIIFGAFLNTIGADKFFLSLALSLLGFARGGAAKAAIVGSTLFGTLSGSIVANIATTGSITIPLMKKTGYSSENAAAIESCASTGGMFMPPIMGVTAFLIAEFLEIPYWEVCVSALAPALAYYIVLFVQVHIEAVKSEISGIPRDQIPTLRHTMRTGWQFLLPLALLIFMLGVLKYSAESSIVYTLGSLAVISFFRRDTMLTPKKLIAAMEASARGMIAIGPLVAAIMIIVGSLSITGAGANLSTGLLALSGQNLYLLLLLTAGASFVLGMGMTAVSCYLLTVVVLAPALIKLGVVPIAAHLFIFYFGTVSFITPPVCIGTYVAASIAKGQPWKTAMRTLRFGAAAFLMPWAFVFNPNLLMLGSAKEIFVASCCVLIGTVSVSLGLGGFLLTHLKGSERILFIVSGICVLLPSYVLKGAGILVIVLSVTRQLLIQHGKNAGAA